MRPLTHVLALTAVALAGCLDRADLSLNVPGPPEPVPEFDCERITEPLAVRATPARARIGSRVLLTATGGSGHYRFGLEPGGSGGELQGGALVTGPTPANDTAFVEDTSCGGKATVLVEVLGAFAVAPSRATLKPGASFKIAVDGTVGAPVFALLQAGSSGTLTADGHYTAGSTNGLDLVQVRDSATGDEALLQYEVKSSARFRASPDRLALPSGSSIPLRAAEGTGHVVWTKLSGYGTVEGSRFLTDAMASGVTELQAVDLFTGETAGLSIRILDDLERDSVPHGRLGDVAVIVTGNFDGDGIEDIAVGLPTSNLARPTGGAVFIFKGSPEGFGESPTWTLAGPSDTAQFGVALAAGDLDGNGTDELAIGAPGADITIADSGAVYLYRFDAAGPQLLRTPLTNPGRGRFGSSLELADMDSDGDLDLVVGSPAADLAPTATVRNRGIVDVFLLSRNAPVPDLPSIRLGGMDLNADGGVISRSNTAIGRGVLALDLNEDKTIDLAALGFINEVLADGGLVTRPAIQVHLSRGGKDPFRPVPDAYVLPRNPSDSSEGTYRLAGIPGGSGLPPLLMVSIDAADSPDLSADGGYRSGTNAGGALLFDLSDISPAEPPSQSPAKLDRTDAYARIYGESASISAGRSFEVMDVDGEPGPELLLGAPYASPVGADDAGVRLAGKVLVYPLSGLAPGAVLNKPLTSLPGGAPTDVLGVGLRRWSRPGGGHGLLAVAGRASTVWGNFTGRLDAYVPNADAFSSWTTRTRSGLPATAALEQFGVSVAAARSRDGSAAAFIGAPGVSGRGSLNDGNDVSAGAAFAFNPATPSSPALVVEGAASPLVSGGRNVGSDVAFTDFDGDGRQDLLVGSPLLQAPGSSVRSSAIAPVYAREHPGCIPDGGTPSTGSGGVQVLLGQSDGTWTSAYRLWAPINIAGCDGGTGCSRSGIGRQLAGGFDFNGDGREDVGATRNNGFEIFLGRAPDSPQLEKLTMACDPVVTRPFTSHTTSVPASVGDIDADGCDEVAYRYASGALSGVAIVFGFNADPAKCGGHTQPATLRISGDAEAQLSNMRLGIAVTRAGKFLGDAREFLAISAGSYRYEGIVQPAVLLFDMAQLRSKRPAPGTEVVVGAQGDGLTPIPLVASDHASSFGAALAGGADLTGDGYPELIVGAPLASLSSEAAGAVFVFAGGPKSQGLAEPRLTIAGPAGERSGFGQDVSVVPPTTGKPAYLVIGAPTSYRTGTQNGTAFSMPVEL